MKPESGDLVVRFNPAENTATFLIRKSPKDLGELKTFHTVKRRKEMSNAELIKELGTVVFSFLHATHGEKFAHLEGEE